MSHPTRAREPQEEMESEEALIRAMNIDRLQNLYWCPTSLRLVLQLCLWICISNDDPSALLELMGMPQSC